MKKLFQYIKQNKLYLLNVGATFFSQFTNAISLIVLTPLLTKCLGLKEFGTYGVIINVISFSVILDFGLNIGLVRTFIHKLPGTNELLNSLFVFYASLLTILLPIYYLFYHNYFQSEFNYSIVISVFTSIIVVQNMFAVYFDSLIQTLNKIYISKIIRSLKLVLELLFIILFLKDISLKKILYITSSINIIYILSLFLYLRNQIKFKINIAVFNLKLLLNHFKYSIWYFVSSVATVLVFNTQIVILNYFSGPEYAAKYLVVVRFFDIVRIAATNFTQVLFPKIIQAEVKLQWIELKAMFFRLLKRISLLVCIILILFWSLGFKIFEYWIGFKDVQIIPLYHLYLIFTCLIILDNVSVVFLSALKFNKVPTILSIFQGLSGIVLSILFLKYFGLIGLLIGFFISFILTNLFFNPAYLVYSMNKKSIQN
jgi:O-antigen/teichoic acid export membrane protein